MLGTDGAECPFFYPTSTVLKEPVEMVQACGSQRYKVLGLGEGAFK